jgi:hypothetical protein
MRRWQRHDRDLSVPAARPIPSDDVHTTVRTIPWRPFRGLPAVLPRFVNRFRQLLTPWGPSGDVSLRASRRRSP